MRTTTRDLTVRAVLAAVEVVHHKTMLLVMAPLTPEVEVVEQEEAEVVTERVDQEEVALSFFVTQTISRKHQSPVTQRSHHQAVTSCTGSRAVERYSGAE